MIALMEACDKGHVTFVLYLIEQVGVDINMLDEVHSNQHMFVLITTLLESVCIRFVYFCEVLWEKKEKMTTFIHNMGLKVPNADTLLLFRVKVTSVKRGFRFIWCLYLY